MMYCPFCGSENSLDSQFCGECGRSLAEVERPGEIAPTVTLPPETPAPAMPGIRAQSRVFKVALPVFVAALFVVGAFTIYFLVRVRTEEITDVRTARFETKHVEDPDLPQGLSFVKTEGKNGKRRLKIKIWKDREGAEIKRQVVASTTFIAPISKVITEGAKPKKAVIAEIKDEAAKYIDARKEGDFAKVLTMSEPESISGYDAGKISNSYAVTKDQVASYKIFEPTVNIRNLSASTADVPVTIVLTSPMFGRREFEQHIGATYIDKAWKFEYFGQWNAVAPILAKVKTGTDDYDDTSWSYSLTLKYIIMFPSRTLVIFEERNTSSVDNPYPADTWEHDSWEPPTVDSEFSDTSDIEVTDDLGQSKSLPLSETRSTIRSDSIEAGKFQLTELVFDAGINTSANSLTIKTSNFEFAGVKLP